MTGGRKDIRKRERPASIRLQEKLAELIPLKHFLVTGFARNGLLLLIRALRWDNSAEIIIPAFTCSVIKHTIEEAGAVPVPVDAEDDGINIDPEKIAGAITASTKAIYVVHTYGIAAQIEKICSLARKHNLIVIEDLAHAPFSIHRGRPLGTYGDFAILSFTKKLINFEGGAIGTNNTSIYAKMVMLQREYEPTRSYSLNFFLDNYARIAGSWWETRFSLFSLLFMKLNDVINTLVYRGAFGISIDEARYYAGNASNRLTLWQLDSLYRTYRDNPTDYLEFRNKYRGITVYDPARRQSDTLPHYLTGAVTGKNPLFRLASFRTWHNSNEPGAYPRADYLYKNYRIFSKAIMLFHKKERSLKMFILRLCRMIF